MNDWIAGHVRHCKAGGLARNTIDSREELLNRVDNALPMGIIQATVEELADWLANDRWSAKTKCTYYEHIRAFFKWLIASGTIDYDPSASLARPRVHRRAPKPISESELALILERTTGFWHLVAELAAFEGLRCCEVATIRREDITVDNVIVRGKGGVEIAVPTHAVVWQTVKDLPKGNLAATVHGAAVSPNYISQTFPREVRRATGLLGIAPHRLRHRFATILLTDKEDGGAGYDLRTVQELMRHASPNQTAIYTQITDGQRRKAIRALPVPTSASC